MPNQDDSENIDYTSTAEEHREEIDTILVNIQDLEESLRMFRRDTQLDEATRNREITKRELQIVKRKQRLVGLGYIKTEKEEV